jgi:hypothetical protein
MNKKEVKLIDKNGYMWIWDGERIYNVDAEKEFIEMGIDVMQNGYPASTLKEAKRMLDIST